MELRELKYFLAVAQEQSITKAAEYLYIAQPSLSKQMQNLEKEVGRPLFLRGSRKITLTETGILLKKRAEEMIALYEKTQAEISAAPEEVGGDVFIGGGESYALMTVAQAAREVQVMYPSVRFNLYSGDAAYVLEKLDKGLIDFGVVVDFPDIEKYCAMRLPHEDEWGVLLRRDDPLAAREGIRAEDLFGARIITSQQALKPRSRVCEWFGKDVGRLNVVARYNLIYNASLLVKAGMGCALGLDRLINTAADGELCFRPLMPAVRTTLDLVWKKYAVFSKPAQIFLDALTRHIGGR